MSFQFLKQNQRKDGRISNKAMIYLEVNGRGSEQTNIFYFFKIDALT